MTLKNVGLTISTTNHYYHLLVIPLGSGVTGGQDGRNQQEVMKEQGELERTVAKGFLVLKSG